VDKEAILASISVNERIISASGCLPLNGEVFHNFTITHNDYRNKGYGKAVQALKLKELCQRGITDFNIVVAKDNALSIKLCESNNLEVVDNIILTRGSGKYEALVYSLKPSNLILPHQCVSIFSLIEDCQNE